MYEEDLYKTIISELSKELSKIEHSNSYRIGKFITDTLDEVKALKLAHLWNRVIRHVLYPRLGCDRRSKEWKEYIKNNVDLSVDAKLQSESATVYTCVTGNYDSLIRTPVRSARTRYILYTDNPCIDAPGWEIELIPDELRGHAPAYINRYIKLHPYKYYDTAYTVYIDGNLWLLSDIWEMCERAHESALGIGMFAHGYRDCVYDEARVCEILRRGSREGIKRQVESCAKAGVKHHSGLMEACIIVTDQTSDQSRQLYNTWWDEFISNGSERDQLALPAAVYRLGLKMVDFAILGDNARADSRLHFDAHRK